MQMARRGILWRWAFPWVGSRSRKKWPRLHCSCSLIEHPTSVDSPLWWMEVRVRAEYKTALIIGAGVGISASLARALSGEGLKVGLVGRHPDKLQDLARESKAAVFQADAADPAAVAQLFNAAEAQLGALDVVVYNPSQRAHGPVAEIDPAAVRNSLAVTAFGGFLAVQEAAKRMIPRKHGAILLTGATASIKGFALSSAFAMGKFALRGLAQSAARELGPKGIHVAHFIIDGAVRSSRRADPTDRPDSTLNPDSIAQTYLDVVRGGDVKEEAGEEELQHEPVAGHHGVQEFQLHLLALGALQVGGRHRLQKCHRVGNALLQILQGALVVGEARCMQVRQARNRTFRGVAGPLDLPRQWQHVRSEPRIHQHLRVDLVIRGVCGGPIEILIENAQPADQDGDGRFVH